MSETEIQELKKQFEESFTVLHKEQPYFYTNKIFNYLLSIIESDRKKIQEMSKRLNLNYGGGFTEEEITIGALRKEIQALTKGLNGTIEMVKTDLNDAIEKQEQQQNEPVNFGREKALRYVLELLNHNP